MPAAQYDDSDEDAEVTAEDLEEEDDDAADGAEESVGREHGGRGRNECARGRNSSKARGVKGRMRGGNWEGEAKEEQAKQLPGFVLLVRFGVGWSGLGYNVLRTIVWNSTWGYSKLHNNNTL